MDDNPTRGMKRKAHDVESNIEAGRKRAKGSGASLVPSTTGIELPLLVPSTTDIELPLDLIVLIASYLSMKDQRTLSHCSKSFRSTMRTANLIRYKLSKESCRRYVDDLEFRNVVDSRGHVWEFELSYYNALVDVTFGAQFEFLY